MFYPLYTIIKERLNSVSIEVGKDELKPAQWFNMQYDGAIPLTPLPLIEFPEKINKELTSKESGKLPFVAHVHIVTKADADQEGNILDSLAELHEYYANAVNNHLDWFKPEGFEHLEQTTWQHWHKYKGWMVTVIGYKTYQRI